MNEHWKKLKEKLETEYTRAKATIEISDRRGEEQIKREATIRANCYYGTLMYMAQLESEEK